MRASISKGCELDTFPVCPLKMTSLSGTAVNTWNHKSEVLCGSRLDAAGWTWCCVRYERTSVSCFRCKFRAFSSLMAASTLLISSSSSCSSCCSVFSFNWTTQKRQIHGEKQRKHDSYVLEYTLPPKSYKSTLIFLFIFSVFCLKLSNE